MGKYIDKKHVSSFLKENTGNSFSFFKIGGRMFTLPVFLLGFICSQAQKAESGSVLWHSSQVFYDSSGDLKYSEDSEGNRIPDYSYAGYHYGELPLPQLSVVKILGPVEGDNTARIQAALNLIGEKEPDKAGRRGVLLLEPGNYEIRGTLRIPSDGVVLRGSGDKKDPSVNTILQAVGDSPHQRTVLEIGSGDASPWTAGSSVNITDPFVQVGSMSFHVEDSGKFQEGQEVLIRHPSSQEWIDAVNGGGVVDDPRWEAGTKDLVWVRRIEEIKGKEIFLDAPIYNHLNRQLTQSTIAPVIKSSLVKESGIEDLRIDIETKGGEDEDHAWNAIALIGAENCWVQNVSTTNFGYAGVKTSGTIRITIKKVRAMDPVAVRTGGRMYNFSTDRFSQLILFTECYATNGRHSFVSNGTTTVSGVVVHRCTMEGGDFEAHRHWSQGLLLDNLRELSSRKSQAKLINRGDMGSSHGWGAAHSTIWGFNREIVVQKPPTAQNYAVSTEGWLRDHPFQPGPWGSVEILSGQIVPESLYEAQLSERRDLELNPKFDKKGK